MAKRTESLILEEIKELCKIPENLEFFRKTRPDLFKIGPLADVITISSKLEDIKFDVYILNPDYHWVIEQQSLHGGKTQQVLRPMTKEPHF